VIGWRLSATIHGKPDPTQYSNAGTILHDSAWRSARVSAYQNTISVTSDHGNSTPMVHSIHSQAMTSYWCSAVCTGGSRTIVEF